jgi:hypothetical protein
MKVVAFNGSPRRGGNTAQKRVLIKKKPYQIDEYAN